MIVDWNVAEGQTSDVDKRVMAVYKESITGLWIVGELQMTDKGFFYPRIDTPGYRPHVWLYADPLDYEEIVQDFYRQRLEEKV